MSVLILHTLPPGGLGATRLINEFDLAAAARGIAGVLPGAAVVGVRGEAWEIIEHLRAHRPDVVFNLCEAPLGRADLEAHAAALLEWMGVRFTGSRSATLALCRRKDNVNAVLAAAGVPTPRAGQFPCIVKPADEDGSVGVDARSICEDETQLDAAVHRWAKPVIVEEFLPGREFVVSLWGPMDPEFISIGETVFRNGLRLLSYAAKWDDASADYANSPLFYDTPIETPLRETVLAAARAAWRAVDARGYLRVDVRLDREDRPKVLDVNPNPEIGPDAGISRAVVEAGWRWEDFILKQVEWA